MTEETVSPAAPEAAGYESDAYIETATGAKFFIGRPEFNLTDIIHALSHLCRFGGHSKQFYSVAEHSLLVSRLVEDLALGDPFEALMHDAAEAYLVDIPRPWKALLPDYKALEAKVQASLREWAGLPAVPSAGVKRADRLALFIEARVLMPSRGQEWAAPPDIIEQAADLHYEIRCYNPRFAMQQFSMRCRNLVERTP